MSFRALIDILTPKQVHFSIPLSKRLEEEGFEVLRTTRRYGELVELLELKGVEVVKVGRYGGRTLEGKLKASSRRVVELASLAMKYKPHIAISFCSPEMARVAFGLRIPHICIGDSPHAEAVCRLTIPLSRRLIAPKVVPREAWLKFGASPDMIVSYDALDAVAWIKGLKPDPFVPEELHLTPRKPIMVLRVEESFAAYLLDVVEEGRSILVPVIEQLIESLREEVQFVVLPRYREQRKLFRAMEKDVVIPSKAIDGPSLLAYTSIFIGAGGTMTAEACLLGVPAISCYPGEPTFVERFLIEQGLLTRTTSPVEVVERATHMLDRLDIAREEQKRKARNLVARMEDPVEVIVRTVKEEVRRRSAFSSFPQGKPKVGKS